MDVQERIKRLMEAKGWTEYKLAKEAGLPQSTISHLFKRNNAPTYPTINSICGAFGITMVQFFADDGKAVVLTSEQRELLLIWGSLSEKQKDIVRSTILEFGGE